MSRVPFRRPTDFSDRDALPPATRRALRAEYDAPADPAYWDGLEGRIMAAVRQGASSAVSTARAPLEWWQALAGWSRPGMVAAAAILFLTGVVSARVSRDEGERTAGPGDAGLPELTAPAARLAPNADPDLARILEAAPEESAQAARDAAYLLSGGLERRRAVRLDSLEGARHDAPTRESSPEAVRRAEREATFRYVLPEE